MAALVPTSGKHSNIKSMCEHARTGPARGRKHHEPTRRFEPADFRSGHYGRGTRVEFFSTEPGTRLVRPRPHDDRGSGLRPTETREETESRRTARAQPVPDERD